MELLLNCLLIFSVRVFDVTLGTMSTVLVVRGKRGFGSLVGFVDLVIWFLVVRQALSIETDTIFTTIIIAIAYAGGYGVGTFVGSWAEEKLAIGSASFNVVTRGLRYDLVDVLRSKGYGVSTIVVQGKEGENLMLLTEVARKKLDDINNIVKSMAPDAFISISDTRKVINGYINR